MHLKSGEAIQLSTEKSSGSVCSLSAEQTLQWLDGQREWMFEIWQKNPQLRSRWSYLKRIK